MPEIRCHACGIRPKSAGANPPPSWLQRAGLVLCEDCRADMVKIEAGYLAAGIPADAATVLAEVRQLNQRRLQTRPMQNLSYRSEP